MAKIDVKYNLDDEVFVITSDRWRNHYITRGKVKAVFVDKDGAEYLVDGSDKLYKEEYLLSVNCSPDELYDRIYKMTDKEEKE